jgi:hypothetical protein
MIAVVIVIVAVVPRGFLWVKCQSLQCTQACACMQHKSIKMTVMLVVVVVAVTTLALI